MWYRTTLFLHKKATKSKLKVKISQQPLRDKMLLREWLMRLLKDFWPKMMLQMNRIRSELSSTNLYQALVRHLTHLASETKSTSRIKISWNKNLNVPSSDQEPKADSLLTTKQILVLGWLIANGNRQLIPNRLSKISSKTSWKWQE